MLEMTDDVVIEEQESQQVDDEKKWCVYIHTNKINFKKYVGLTCQDPEERWKNGLGYKKNHPVFWSAIVKYGWDNFDHQIVFSELTKLEAIKKEIELIALYKTNCSKYYNPAYGYNCTDGGEGSCGWIPSEDTRQKISMANSGENNFMYGKHHSEETKQKISNSRSGKLTGESNPNYGKHINAGENHPMYGKHHTEETKQKISENRKGKGTGRRANTKHLSEEHKKKLSRAFSANKNPMYGKHHSEETKEKISQSKLGKSNGRNHYIPVYCIELNLILQAAIDARKSFGFDPSCVTKCCKGKVKSCGKNPETGEKLHWIYVFDQKCDDGAIIQGAITLGHITEERAHNYLNSLKQKGND